MSDWIDSLSEEEAGAAIKFMQQGMDSLSEEEAGLLIPHIDKLKKPQTPTTDKLSEGLIQAGKTGLQRAAGGLVGTGAAIADYLGGALKFPAGALLSAGDVLTGGSAKIAKEAGPAAIEETFPSVGSKLESLGGEYARGAQSAHQALMAPVEALTKALGVPGQAIRAVGGPEELASGTDIATMLGAAVVPGVRPVVGKATKPTQAPIVKEGPAYNKPTTEKIGFPFNKTEVPTNFVKPTPSVRATNDAVDKLLAEEAQVAQQQKPVVEPTQLELDLGQPQGPGRIAAMGKKGRMSEGFVPPELRSYSAEEANLMAAPRREAMEAEPTRPVEAPEQPLFAEENVLRTQGAETPAEPLLVPGTKLEDIFFPKEETAPLRDLSSFKQTGNLDISVFAEAGKKINEKLKLFGNKIEFFSGKVEDPSLRKAERDWALDFTHNNKPVEATAIIKNKDGKKIGHVELVASDKGGLEVRDIEARKMGTTILNELKAAGIDIKPSDYVTEGGKKMQDKVWPGWSEKSALGGVGKKQGGAVGTKSELVTPEQIMEQYKQRTGKDLDATRAIAAAKEVNSKVENVKAKVSGGKTPLAKKLGNPFTSKEPLTPEEAKIALDTNLIKDVDNNTFKKIINTGARVMGSTYGIRAYYNNALLEGMMRPLSRAADAAKYRADHVLYGKEGVVTKIRALTQEEFTSLWEAMSKVEGRNTPWEQVSAGLSRNAQAAGAALREAYKQDLAIKNEARAIEGKKPISERANYLASTWFGDRISHILDADGNMVGVVTGYSKDITAAKEWLAKNKPDHQMTPEVSNVFANEKDWFRVTDNLAELYDLVLEANKKGEVSVQESIIQAMMNERALSSSRVKGTYLHEKFKRETPVWGAQGFKPWVERDVNAKEGFEAQVKHIEDSLLRAELSKAAKNLEDFRLATGETNAYKIAKAKLEDMQGTNNYMRSVEQRIKRGLSETEIGQKLVGSARTVDPLISASINTKFFAGNVRHMVTNIYEVFTKTPLAVMHGMKEVEGMLKFAAPWGAMKGTAHLSQLIAGKLKGDALTGDAKFFHDYAMRQNVGNPTVELSQNVSPKTLGSRFREETRKNLNATIIVPEIVGRYTSFTLTAHSLRAMGLEKQHAADLAHDLVKFYFKDYSSLEMPAMFSRLGTLGTSGRQMRTWMLGEIMAYSSAIANKQPLLLSTAVGLSALVYGVDSVPLFKEIDELVNILRNFSTKMGGDFKTADAASRMLTPREYLYAKTGGDLRGVMDKSMEAMGVEGSSLASTDFRMMPYDVKDVIVKIGYLTDSGMSLYNAAKEVLKDDPDATAILKNIVEPVAPSAIPRAIEIQARTTKSGVLLNEKKQNVPSKEFQNQEERLAYLLGWQPKKWANEKVGTELDKRRKANVAERQLQAKEKLVDAYNNLQLHPESQARYKNAVQNFVKQHGGAASTDESMRAAIRQAAMEMQISKENLAKIDTIKNAKNNMEVVRFFTEVTGMPKTRFQK